MIDLTPLDVRKKRGDFRRILRGYDPGEVDTFLEAVEERMEALVMENLALTEKAQRLASHLEALEGREKAVQEALVTAQKLREDVQDQSKREATSLREQVTREAESLREQVKREAEWLRGEAHREASILRDEAIREAASVRDQARRESEFLRREVLGEIEARVLEAEGLLKERQRVLEDLERSRQKFLKGFRTLLEREMDAVEVEESRRPLEDTALELNLRGWLKGREEEMGGEEEGGDGVAPQEEEAPSPASSPTDPYEPVFDLDGQETGGPGEATPRGWGAMPGEEPPQGEFGDIVPLGVFDLPGEGGEASADGEEGEQEEDEGPDNGSEESVLPAEGNVPDAAVGLTVNLLLDRQSDRGATKDTEPLWLSNLLEQAGAEDDTGGPGAEEAVPATDSDAAPGGGEAVGEEDEDEPRID